MKKLIIISLALLFAIPTMAMADYKADRADLLASAGLFNIAALDNPAYAGQAEGMAKDTSRGRVTISGRVNLGGKGQYVHEVYEGEINHNMMSQYHLTGTAKDVISTAYTFTFYYNNGRLTSTQLSDNRYGNNRTTTYSGTSGIAAYSNTSYSSRRPQ